MGTSGCGSSDVSSTPAIEAATARPVIIGQPRESARVFISGHSLVDQPLPDYLGRVAASRGTPMEWERQYVVGSSIVRRTRGEDRGSPAFAGYRQGYNRSGEGLDVVQEFLAPQRVSGPYDVLLITEQHGMLETLVWNDTVRHLRHFHDRFIAGNPTGTTFFYEPWISMDDKSNPARWIAYERAASPIWQCMATRVNVSLAHEGRADRIVTIPAGLALAHLIDVSTREAGLAAITRNSVRETIDSIVNDEVHLTHLGVYYISLVVYASIYQQSPLEAWYPSEHITEAQARSLARVAAEFTTAYYEQYKPLTLSECRARLEDGLIGDYWDYIRDSYWQRELGTMHAYARWMRRMISWRYTLTRDDDRNPFHFDADSDAGHWLPSE